MVVALRSGLPMRPGQPPITSRSSMVLSSVGFCLGCTDLPSSRDPRLTEELEYPSSDHDRVDMSIVTIRPAPECSLSLSPRVADPVRINWLVALRLSVSILTLFQMEGASCHSSISLGVSPSSTSCGEISARILLRVLAWRLISLFAKRRAVSVLPQALAPLRNTAPDALRAVFMRFSTNLFTYDIPSS